MIFLFRQLPEECFSPPLHSSQCIFLSRPFLPLFWMNISLTAVLKVYIVPKFKLYRFYSQYIVEPTPFAFKMISLSLPSLTTKWRISLNLLASSALQTTSNYNFYPGSKNACFTLGLKIDTFWRVKAWNSALILELLTTVTFKK